MGCRHRCLSMRLSINRRKVLPGCEWLKLNSLFGVYGISWGWLFPPCLTRWHRSIWVCGIIPLFMPRDGDVITKEDPNRIGMWVTVSIERQSIPSAITQNRPLSIT